jgi:hypothetical protein
MHQQLMTEAEKITGYASEPETPKIDPDPATGSIKIKYNDDPKTKYTWKDFTLDQGQDHRLDWQDRTREVRAVVAHHHRSIPWARGKAEVRVPVKRQGAVRHRGAVLRHSHQLGQRRVASSRVTERGRAICDK